MKRCILLSGLTALACLALPAAGARAGGLADEIVVQRAGGLTAGERARADVSTVERLPIAGVTLVRAEGDREAALATLRADRDVAWAEPNLPRAATPAGEPLFGLLWGLENTGQRINGTSDADIDAPGAWTVTRGAGVTVAVVDTGVDLGHPDLAGRLAQGKDYVDGDLAPQDANGHGTHVAGTIAAGANGVGVIGVAPEATLMPLRVLNANGEGSSADVAAAFAFAGDRGARVVNASLGSSQASTAERLAIEQHPGTLYVVAAGNAGADVDRGAPSYPCSYAAANVLCVGASDAGDRPAAFSNFGSTSVDLFAPGDAIASTYLRGRPSNLARDGYRELSGTSMAAPHAAGVAALAAGVQASWSGARIGTVLAAGVDPLPVLAGRAVTGGRLNAAGALGLAVAGAATPAPLAPAPAPLAPLAPAPLPAAPPAPPHGAAPPLISGLHVTGRPRDCALRGCRAPSARLAFGLAARAPVAVALERRRCRSTGCGWGPRGAVTRLTAAGAVRWGLSPRLLGLPLGSGRWRVTLATSAGRTRTAFAIR